MARTRSTATKLAGWSILAGAAAVIVGIFLVTRLAGPGTPAPVATASVVASSSAIVPSSAAAASEAASSAPSEAGTAPSAPASSAPPPTESSSAASSSELVVVDAAAMNQSTRKALLNTLIQQGVFTGVEAVGSPPKVGVTPLFQGLNPNLQSQFIAAVYSYVNNGASGGLPLQVIDATTGKIVGNYTAADGLKLL